MNKTNFSYEDLVAQNVQLRSDFAASQHDLNHAREDAANRKLRVEKAEAALAAAREEVKRLKKLGMDGVDREEKLERELADAREELAQLVNLLYQSPAWTGPWEDLERFDHRKQARAALDAAKEGKP